MVALLLSHLLGRCHVLNLVQNFEMTYMVYALNELTY